MSLIPPGPLLQTFTGHTSPVCALAVLADGQMVSVSTDGEVLVSDVASGESRALKGHAHLVTSLAVLPDGRVVSGSYDGTLEVWDVAGGESRALKGRHTGWVRSLAVLADGRVVSGSYDGTLEVWDVAERRELGAHRPRRLRDFACGAGGRAGGLRL